MCLLIAMELLYFLPLSSQCLSLSSQCLTLGSRKFIKLVSKKVASLMLKHNIFDEVA
ncbi:MAG: hypothetical protein LBP77_02170 [Rickettsiales bacterium]|nr:hypothetical protein [Rickettsiales bacterium]